MDTATTDRRGRWEVYDRSVTILYHIHAIDITFLLLAVAEVFAYLIMYMKPALDFMHHHDMLLLIEGVCYEICDHRYSGT